VTFVRGEYSACLFVRRVPMAASRKRSAAPLAALCVALLFLAVAVRGDEADLKVWRHWWLRFADGCVLAAVASTRTARR
jgi:hypothetical protein